MDAEAGEFWSTLDDTDGQSFFLFQTKQMEDFIPRRTVVVGEAYFLLSLWFLLT